jgi:hypothetical protein
MTAKIEYALGAARLFIHHLHREGFDRGMIASFGNDYRVEHGFTSTESYLHAALTNSRLSPNEIKRKNEGTRLYDSIEDVINEFWRNGKRDRPWLLTVITDGKDYYDYGKYKNNPYGIGRFIAIQFNHEPSNFIFVIGVGEGDEIDKNALSTMADSGNFLAVNIGAFSLLEAVFLKIAINVSSELVGRRIEVGNLSWQEVSHLRQISQTALDYAFLIDRSGSMSGLG